MKNKIPLFFLLGLMVLVAVNSCKKDSQTSIQSLFTTGKWQLASAFAFQYIGDQLVSTDTLNTNCNTTQFFTFNSDKTCTYTNFDCISQPVATGQWSLSPNQLFLAADITCKDSTSAGSSKPFLNSQIINLGQFSMILQTGDIQPNYSTTKKRRIFRFGFIRQKIN